MINLTKPVRQLISMIEPLKELAEAAEKINSLEQFEAEVQGRVKSAREQEAAATSNLELAKEKLELAKAEAMEYVKKAKEQAKEQLDQADRVAQQITDDAADEAASKLEDSDKHIEENQAILDDIRKTAADMKEQADCEYTRLVSIREAIAKASGV